MSDPNGTFHQLGPAADISLGQTKNYKVDGHGLVVANCDGDYHAIEDRCTHDDGPLGEGKLWGCLIECPRHGARFDMKTGQVRALPATRPVASYPVRVVDGMLEVQLPPAEGDATAGATRGFSL
ncbi:MAG: non-heme iron oxygenase ferredoxin subunit [Dehalococcoidia bacterium]|nr:non-heme iron oxygenase ferredoxin subunit [Dehalococcoidia bacterium]